MTTNRAYNFTRAEVEAMLDNLSSSEADDVSFASALFDAQAMSILDGRSLGLPDDAIGYELEANDELVKLVRSRIDTAACALTNGALPLRRAVVLKSEHDDLKCSSPTCRHGVCPFGLAACFTALEGLGASTIPLYSESLDVTQAISRFRRTWSARLLDSENALNLLLSRSENDFSGALVVDDDAYLDGFIDDLSTILVRMGKIDEGGVKRMHISNLLRAVNSSEATFHMTSDENLEPRKLYVCDRLSDFFREDPETNFAARYLIERFGHIVDHRYLVLVGTRGEISRFTGLAPTLELLLGEHVIELAGMSADAIWNIYRERLDDAISSMIDEEFHQHFLRYVEFNRDALPFHGEELADYLAKTSNAAGTLALPRSRYQSSSLDEMLDAIVGLESVKTTVKELESYAIFSKRVKGRGKCMPSSGMHMLFTGNPGTGKTTVARIIATMLYKIGIIPQNKFMEVTSKDLIARYVGHTDKQVHETVQAARGGVLFIDEAYALAPDEKSSSGFGKEAIAELVKSMEDYRDDLVIILAGYEREMQSFIDVNPGLASRISYTFRFEDFNTDQLVEIFHRELKAAGMEAGSDIEPKLRDLFDYFRGFKSFGNGRFAREVVQKAIIAHANRVASMADEGREFDAIIDARDIPSRRDMLDCANVDDRSAEELLAPLVGLDAAKNKVMELDHVVRFREAARAAGMKLPEMNLHMVFTGNPGTGKTTIARVAGRVLYNIGAVPTDHFIEIEAKDLIKPLVGGTSSETAKFIESALGGVLFIDEAYALLESSSGLECIATLVKAMEDHKSELVVMFAGYENEMRRFLDANPGLASRVGYTFRFEDYKASDLLEIFMRKMQSAGFEVTDAAREAALELMRYFQNVENFGNGRFVDRVIQEVITLRATVPDSSEVNGIAKTLDDKASEKSRSSDEPRAFSANEQEPASESHVQTSTPRFSPALNLACAAELKSEPANARGATSDLRRIGSEHIPSIEAMCKLTATAIFEPSDVSADHARRRVASHEVGHALTRLALFGETDIVVVTIEQEGTGTLGYVQHERRSNPLPTSFDIENEIAVFMAGMAAENMVFGRFSAGNSSDLEAATKLAKSWATTWGMSDAGFLQFPAGDRSQPLGVQDLPQPVRDEMNALLKRCLEKATGVLEEHRDAFDAMVTSLLEKETMSGEEISAVWNDHARAASSDLGNES